MTAYQAHRLFIIFSFIVCLTPLRLLAQSFVNTTDTSSHRLYDFTGSQYGLVLARLNNDPYPDMVTSGRYEDIITVQYNDGKGSFGNSTTFSVGIAPEAVVSADFNADGLTDLAVGCQGSFFIQGSIAILINGGNGPMGVTTTYLDMPIGLHNLTVADFNNDGRPDITVGGGYGKYQILTGRGDGTFIVGAASVLNNDTGIRTTAADFDRDGWVGLAFSSASNVRILRNTGAGQFTQVFSWVPTSNGTIVGLDAGDANNDGWPDVALAVYTEENGVLLLTNSGSGQITNTPHVVGNAALATFVRIADATGDGIADLLVGQLAKTSIQLWQGTSGGTLQPVADYQTGGGWVNQHCRQ